MGTFAGPLLTRPAPGTGNSAQNLKTAPAAKAAGPTALPLAGSPQAAAPLAASPLAASRPAASRQAAPAAAAARAASPRTQPQGPAGLVADSDCSGELLLMPGQLYFGKAPPSIRTLLGSCVALTLWHPGRRIGGMCHYLLPERRRSPDQQRDGRYGNEALELLIEMLQRLGTRASEYEAHLYGGADTLPDHVTHKTQVGVRNIEVGWGLVDQHGFQLVGVDVGDNVPRTVRLDLRSGEVQMRRSER